jgi:hypothetical protein
MVQFVQLFLLNLRESGVGLINVSCDSIPSSGDDIERVGRESPSRPVEVEAREVVEKEEEEEDGTERDGEEQTLNREESRGCCMNSGEPFSAFDELRL